MREVLLFLFGRAGADEGFQFSGQFVAVLFGQFHEAEGLEAALGGPHRKEHFSAGADTGRAEVKQRGHLDALIERVLQREQSAIDGELIHAGPNLAPVFEQHHCQHRATELDAGAPLAGLSAGPGHILWQYRMTGGR